MGKELTQAVKAATGIRGLVLLTCGPSWTVTQHFIKILELMHAYIILSDAYNTL
jgi:hypothetical protein